MPSLARTILHVDMDAFFAAVEQLDDPALRGKPLLIGSDRPRGVVATASYEARPFGCRSAMPMAVAKRLCPQAIIVPVRMSRYREVSDHLFRILDDFSPVVEPVSVDEAFMDMTGMDRLAGSGEQIAVRLRRRIREELHLTASVGVAPNKFLAKLASDLKKPDGLTVVTAEDIDHILPPLPVTRIWGIGPKTADRLAGMNIKTIGDLRRMPGEFFSREFGEDGERFRRLIHGEDDRAVHPDSEARSISHETTFEEDITDPQHLRDVLLDQVENVARRCRKHGLRAGTIRLKIRIGGFKTFSRSRTLAEPTHTTAELWSHSLSLLDEWLRDSFQPVRLLGMAAASFTTGSEQLTLFSAESNAKQKHIDTAVDRITAKFGKSAIRRGGA
ncbi:MAG TPA: DNA polymerase IV [Tepidisphaeraceae bacterium]|nr:DNA polymerase IV [Tepidisphaeraceae bacterium]